MYKIKYIPTGHIFELPDIVAKDLKSKFPDDYQILEKNGKKVRDTVKKKVVKDDKTIYSLVVEK
ncbi:MAG: hypothetical protein MJ231_06620 [bacterium]|nr:hypothetical protein [bacterium]